MHALPLACASIASGIATLCNNSLKGGASSAAALTPVLSGVSGISSRKISGGGVNGSSSPAGFEDMIGQPTEVALMMFAKALDYPDARDVRPLPFHCARAPAPSLRARSNPSLRGRSNAFLAWAPQPFLASFIPSIARRQPFRCLTPFSV